MLSVLAIRSSTSLLEKLNGTFCRIAVSPVGLLPLANNVEHSSSIEKFPDNTRIKSVHGPIRLSDLNPRTIPVGIATTNASARIHRKSSPAC